ncbi:hypothetical protein DERP_000456 [Dermatophagoides pteronyssinus]|uniref:Uncharacterized protein n=1 Tax=Dermatophagoides pteronyssinus TaxID=6956 RepID=A0ABQ8J0E9_DERPT|nr:hypothetical protein DERP_000456 [Dermatophagoides pteronyssinus]
MQSLNVKSDIRSRAANESRPCQYTSPLDSLCASHAFSIRVNFRCPSADANRSLHCSGAMKRISSNGNSRPHCKIDCKFSVDKESSAVHEA